MKVEFETKEIIAWPHVDEGSWVIEHVAGLLDGPTGSHMEQQIGSETLSSVQQHAAPLTPAFFNDGDPAGIHLLSCMFSSLTQNSSQLPSSSTPRSPQIPLKSKPPLAGTVGVLLGFGVVCTCGHWAGFVAPFVLEQPKHSGFCFEAAVTGQQTSAFIIGE